MRIIRGKYGRRRFDVPTNITARPTTDFARENIFNVLENLVDFEGKTALDLFAGTGAVSFEFLSRGCASVTANCYRANYMFIATFALDSNVKVNVLDKETAADKEAQVNNILDIVMTFVRKIIDIIKGIFSKIAG